MAAAPPLLSLRGIWKTFVSIPVVKDMAVDVHRGEILALLGENGAGKSTLMKIMSGIYEPDKGRGTITFEGKPVHLESPREAQRLGISMIHQELSLLPNRTVAQNVALGREHVRPGPLALTGLVDARAVRREARDALARIKADVPVGRSVATLSTAQRQQVEIAKALTTNPQILLMDEPTSSLSEEQADALLELIVDLRARGLGIVFTTHRLPEAFRVADRFLVMRDGRGIAEVPASDASPEQVITWMVGRSVQTFYEKPPHEPRAGEPVLRVQGLSGGVVRDASFTVGHGEILGFGGLVGAGRTELARLVFGADRCDSGQIAIDGRPARIHNPADAVAAGMGFLPEDRKAQGLILQLAVRTNMALPALDRLNRRGVIRRPQVVQVTDRLVDRLRIRLRSPDQQVRYLSGGNQQKTVLAKWLMLSPRVLILDEPTRGIDVGAKMEIYHLIGELAQSGMGIVLISSELPELMELSDRIAVMAQGRIMAILDRADATAERIMNYATGHER